MEWATCIAVIYSITDQDSFITATTLLEDINNYLCYKNTKNTPTPNLAVIGNKKDLDHLREVSNKQGKSLAKKHGAGFWEVSASDDYHSTFGPLNSLIVESYLSVITLKNTDTNASTSAPGSLKKQGENGKLNTTKNEICEYDSIDSDCDDEMTSPTTKWPLETRKMRTNYTTDRKKLELKLDENGNGSRRVKKVSVGKLSLDNFLVADTNNNYNLDTPDPRNETLFEEPQRTSSWSKKDKKRSSIRRGSEKKNNSKENNNQSSLKKSHSYSDLASWEKEQTTEEEPPKNESRVQKLAKEIDDNNGYKERTGADAAFATPGAMLSPGKTAETSSFTKISSFQTQEQVKSPRIRKERRKTTGLVVLNETTDTEFNFPKSPDTERGPMKFKRAEKKSVRRKISSIFRGPKIVVETQ